VAKMPKAWQPALTPPAVACPVERGVRRRGFNK
jgi:hypothetical protein